MPSRNPSVRAAAHYRSLDVLRRQHTELHSIIHNLEHSGSELEAKRAIARVIAALAMVQTEI